MVTVLLVHGTFAPDAVWTQKGSTLREALEAAIRPTGDSIECIPIPWSGWNLISHRLAAAEDIRERVAAIHANNANERMYIVGHSHGGSSVAYFLRRFPKEASFVDGCVFLSTPFIAMKAQPNLIDRVRLFAYILWLMLQVSVLFVAYKLLALAGCTSQSYVILLTINLLFGMYLLHSCRSYQFFEKIADRKRKEVDEIVQARNSCDLPAKPYLFLRYSGDEALFGLSFAQSVAYMLNQVSDKTYGILSRIITSAARHRLIGKEFLEALAIFSVSVWLLFSPILITYDLTSGQVQELVRNEELSAQQAVQDQLEAKRKLLRQIDALYGIAPNRPVPQEVRAERQKISDSIEHLRSLEPPTINSVELFKFRLAALLKGILHAMTYGLIALALGSSLIILCLLAFGSAGLTELLFIETSVEVLPYGRHTLHHLDWTAIPDNETGLRHSAVCSSEQATREISQWLAGQTL